jgi:hypothetical protein
VKTTPLARRTPLARSTPLSRGSGPARSSALPCVRLKPRRTGPAVPRIKPGRQEDPVRLAAVRALGCFCCWMDFGLWVQAEAHHPRPGQGTGTKAPDGEAIGLCSRHHNEKHPDSLSLHRDPLEFRARYGTETQILDWVNACLHEGFRHPERTGVFRPVGSADE